MYNKITLMGQIVSAPELRSTQAGVPVTSFTIAVE
ncbi:MAG: single-stranded DNA-binding protein, partial [Oscillospiraceae bacterium]|nr:single-stranded DNA-binding protein [Oscillospiraceae bacterium]